MVERMNERWPHGDEDAKQSTAARHSLLARPAIPGRMVVNLFMAAVLVAAAAVLSQLGAEFAANRESRLASHGSSAATKAVGLAEAYDHCNASQYTDTLELGRSDETLVVHSASKSDALVEATCVMVELGTSDSVADQLRTTTAAMGVRDAVVGDFSYQWSYDPVEGITMVIHDASVE